MTMLLLVVRLGFALAGVLALMWVAAKILSRGGLGALSRDNRVQVLARTPLNRAACVCLVQMADEVLLLGVTEHQVSVLRSRPASDVVELQPAGDERTTVRIPLQPSGRGGFTLTAASRGAELIERLRARTERR